MASKLIKRWKGKRQTHDHQPSATQQVLRTYKLLEPILLSLDPRDLRQARLVSKSWNELVTRSQSLDAVWQAIEQKKMRLVRLRFFGDFSTGKRAFLAKWKNDLQEHYDPTGHPDDAFRKPVELDGAQWMYEVDHCSYLYGAYHSLVGQWFRDTDCYALVYSATSMASFNHIRDWKNMLDAVPTLYPGPICNTTKPGSRILVALIETKCDLTEEREVPAYEGVQLARALGCSFFQTSARTGHNVDTVFETMGKAFRDANRPIS